MTGAQLAGTIADLCRTKPELDGSLTAALTKWLKDRLGKVSTLEDFRRAAGDGHADLVRVYLSTFGPSDIQKTAKKFDPHHYELLGLTEGAQRAHVLALIRRETNPAQPPAGRQPPMPIDEVLGLRDQLRRRAELAKHTPAQLKKTIREKDIGGGHLSSRPTKTEMIEHIEAALASGWPKLHSVMDE